MPRKITPRELRQPRITVIGEGLTEREYFRQLRSIYNFRYDCKPSYFQKASLDDMADLIDRIIEQGGFAVCVCDADTSRNDNTAKEKLKALRQRQFNNERVLICESMPSIEFWFLIHFVNTTKYFASSDEVIKQLKKWLKGYEKTSKYLEKDQWMKELNSYDNIEVACDRASKLNLDSDSYSFIYKAIELFKSTKNK